MSKKTDMTRTQWFVDCDPVHDGVYLFKCHKDEKESVYVAFRRGYWRIGCGYELSDIPLLAWCGLAVKP